MDELQVKEKSVESKLFYVNKKGKKVHLTVTKHALLRAEERWYRMYGTPLPCDPFKWIENSFCQAVKIENPCDALKKRMKKHQDGSMYFKFGSLTFVVNNGVIVTVEIGNKHNRFANRSPLPNG